MNSDPTRAQMRKYLIGIWPEMALENFNRRSDEDKFDLEMAIYYFAHDHHCGQWSNLYAVLSTSKYQPGKSEGDFNDAYMREENPKSFYLYCSLIRHFIKGRQS